MAWWKGASDLLNLEKATAFVDKAKTSSFVEKARALAQDAADAAGRVSESVQEEYRKTFIELDCSIEYLRPNLAVMECPTYDTIARLSARLNADHGECVKIYDVAGAGASYASQFQGGMVALPPGSPAGSPCPGFEVLLETLLGAHAWLQADSRHVVVVHGSEVRDEGFGEASVLLASLLALRGEHGNSPSAALAEVYDRLALRQLTVPSRLRYLGYVGRCLTDLTPTPTCLRLVAVKLDCIPTFDERASVAFRPLVEVWTAGGLVAESPTPLPELLAIDSSADLRLPETCVVSDDVFVVISHVSSEGKKERAATFAFHASFVSVNSSLRLSRMELDGASQDARFPQEMVLELVVQPVTTEKSKPTEVYARFQDAARSFQEDMRRRQEAEKAEAGPDAVEALERTLRGGSSGGARAPASLAEGAEGEAPASKVQSPGAAELKRALAAAAADEDDDTSAKPAAEELPAAPLASGSGKGSSKGAGYAEAAGADAAATPAVEVDARGELDELFTQFDAAIDLVGGGPVSSAPVAPTAVLSGNDDPFGDTEAFLKELDGT